jgi:hypothetical protein
MFRRVPQYIVTKPEYSRTRLGLTQKPQVPQTSLS